MNDIRENLAFVRDEIVRACERAGRDPKSVRLIAVSKTKPVSDMIRAFDEGVREVNGGIELHIREELL